MYCVHDAGYLQNLWPWGQLCKGKVQHWTAPGPDTVWHTRRRVMAPGAVHVRLRARLHTSLPTWHLRCMWQYLLTPVWTLCLYLPVLRRLRISISKELAQSLSPRCSRSQHLLPCLLACTSTMTTPGRAKENFCYLWALLFSSQLLPTSVLSGLCPWYQLYVLGLVLAWWLSAGDEVIMSQFGVHAGLPGGCWWPHLWQCRV